MNPKTRASKAAKKAFDLIHAISRDDSGNPLTLEGVIRSMILKSPSMIQWRDDALNMMYCTLGAGIHWNDAGRLADSHPNNYMNPPPQAGGQGIWSMDFGMDDSLGRMRLPADLVARLKAQRLEELDDAVKTVGDIDNRCRQYRKRRTQWYPFSWYACNLCAPDNAQHDFLLGAIETALLIKQTDVDEYQGWARLRLAKNVALEVLEALEPRAKAVRGEEPEK